MIAMIKKILVPVDGSEYSKKALEFACEIASGFSSELYLLNVREGVATERTTVPLDQDDAISAGRTVTAAATEIVEKQGLDVAGSEVVVGSAANEILEFADRHNIDGIVMGSRGLSDFKGLLLGSVSHKVGHLAKCTCITVR
jgi:nucleotide-binding universal stress UspA family protein